MCVHVHNINGAIAIYSNGRNGTENSPVVDQGHWEHAVSVTLLLRADQHRL